MKHLESHLTDALEACAAACLPTLFPHGVEIHFIRNLHLLLTFLLNQEVRKFCVTYYTAKCSQENFLGIRQTYLKLIKTFFHDCIFHISNPSKYLSVTFPLVNVHY